MIPYFGNAIIILAFFFINYHQHNVTKNHFGTNFPLNYVGVVEFGRVVEFGYV
jgi:hypothetical protein